MIDNIPRDWQGNEIQPGHVMVTVMVWSHQVTSTMGFLDLSTGEFTPMSKVDFPKKEYLWKILGEQEVYEAEGKLYALDGKFRDGTPVYTEITANMLKFTPPNQIICIKDISDDQDMYYQHHFNTI